VKSSSPKLVKAINYWSFPGGLEGSLDVFEALRLAKEHRFDAIELGIFEQGALPLDVTEARCKEIKAEADRLGIGLPSVASGLYWSRSLGDSDVDSSIRAAEDLEAMIRIAAWLGAKTLLVIPGAVDVFFLPDRPKQPYEQVWKNATDGLRKVLPIAEEFGVKLGIENVWNRFLLSPHEMASFIDQFNSPWIGAYVDVANLMPFGYPEDWLRTLGKRVVGVHFKDFRRAVGTAEGFVDLLEGDVDWPEVMEALSEIGYNGPVAAEMIPGYKHYPMMRIANASIAMDAILTRTA
jgi:L-ribulose-5-phosphate 3-epimerase